MLRNTFDTSRKLISGMSTSYMAKGPNSRRSHGRMRNEQRLEEARAVIEREHGGKGSGCSRWMAPGCGMNVGLGAKSSAIGCANPPQAQSECKTNCKTVDVFPIEIRSNSKR